MKRNRRNSGVCCLAQLTVHSNARARSNFFRALCVTAHPQKTCSAKLRSQQHPLLAPNKRAQSELEEELDEDELDFAEACPSRGACQLLAFCFAFGAAAVSTRATSRHEVCLEIANSWPSVLPLGPQLPPPELTSDIVRYAQIRRHEHEPNLVLLCCSWLLLGGGLQLQGAAITHGRKNESRAEGACKAQSSHTEKNEGRAERRPSSFSPTLVGTERT